MKSILVHLDASPRAAVRLSLAQQLADRHGAELNVLYGVLPAMLANAWAASESMGMAAAALADLDREQRGRARANFEKVQARGRVHWLEGGATPYWTLLQHALYADLVVLGQDDAQDTQTGALPPELVSSTIGDTGKPALVVPFAGAFAELPSRVLLAWKPTREAARAVSAALPWLRQATTVDVATRPEGDEGDFNHVAALTHWLRLQGVAAAMLTHGLGEGDVGERLLSLACDTDAELLVMGCYGHSRAREWVLGGASRSVLRSMTLPVLMAH
jgi:nucleotide-binding universal stress UspA family protein